MTINIYFNMSWSQRGRNRLSGREHIKTKIVDAGSLIEYQVIEPCLQQHYSDVDFSSLNFDPRLSTSVNTAMTSLHNELQTRDQKQLEQVYDVLLKMHGHRTPRVLNLLAGDGLLSICMFGRETEGGHKMVVHSNTEHEIVSTLGILPIHGYYGNFSINGRFGCCVREPSFYCQLTQDGNYVVVFGPAVFAHSYTVEGDTPTLKIFKLDPVECLFEKSYPGKSFVKCSPVGIALNPASILKGEYEVALMTKQMEVRFWNVTSEEGSILQLESLKCCYFVEEHYRPLENPIKYSCDGRCLTVVGYLHAKHGVCILINAVDHEIIACVPFKEHLAWLRWLFPMFSTCGTKLAMSTFHHRKYTQDTSKYDVLFYDIPLMDNSLKNLCRFVILKHVKRSDVNQLPLPNDLLQFIMIGCSIDTKTSSKEPQQKRTCSMM